MYLEVKKKIKNYSNNPTPTPTPSTAHLLCWILMSSSRNRIFLFFRQKNECLISVSLSISNVPSCLGLNFVLYCESLLSRATGGKFCPVVPNVVSYPTDLQRQPQ